MLIPSEDRYCTDLKKKKKGSYLFIINDPYLAMSQQLGYQYCIIYTEARQKTQDNNYWYTEMC